MKVILQEKVANLGTVGDVVNVKAGYARNFLIPKDMAVMATEGNVVVFEKRRTELEKRAAAVIAKANARAEVINALVLTLEAQVSDEGKLFGSIGAREIAEAAVAKGADLARSEVALPEGPIRAVGEYEITTHLDGEVFAVLKLHVVGA